MKNYEVRIKNADGVILSKEFIDLEAAITYYDGCIASLQFMARDIYWYVYLIAVHSSVTLLSEEGNEED